MDNPESCIFLEKWQGQISSLCADDVALEEPCEFRLNFPYESGRSEISLAITMRTPGNEFKLALGFLFTEGLIYSLRDIEKWQFCGVKGNNKSSNIIKIFLNILPSKIQDRIRNIMPNSSCGVCGKSSLDALTNWNQYSEDIALQRVLKISPLMIKKLSDSFNCLQKLFKKTGGVHGCGLFNENGEFLAMFEDVGRHNALDKLIGHAISEDLLPLHSFGLFLSGRISFELVYKAALAGISVIVAFGAPSSLAIQLAENRKITLIGFVKNERFNCYTNFERLKL